MWKIKSTKSSEGASQISWKLVFQYLELSSSPSLKLIFNWFAILKTYLRIFFITTIVVLISFYALIIVNEVVSWYLNGQHVSWCQWFRWICIESWCFIKVLFLPWLPLRRYNWSMVKVVSRLLHLSKLELIDAVRLYLFQLSKIIEGSFSLWL